MRVLAAIAHYGTKNRRHLQKMISALKATRFDVDIVILSEMSKDLGPDVEVQVGMPTSNPWSLPYAHRTLFSAERDNYDLFVYSEDDTLVEERHLEAHIRLSELLPASFLPGSLRYEVDPLGRRSFSSFHSQYRWDPDSVFVVNGLTFARFTNDHAAWYAINREQLAQAIGSGGFLVDPHEGRYDMLVSAATDIYTQCGFKRVLCLEHIDDLLVHHLPNVYLGQYGIDESTFRVQIESLVNVGSGDVDRTQLIRPEAALVDWHRHSYTVATDHRADVAPDVPQRVLSVGAGSGDFEASLLRDGHAVTTIPVDNVFGAMQRERGLSVLPPELPSRQTLRTIGRFDTILALNVIQYFPDPVAALVVLRGLLHPGGQVVVTVPNHRRYAARNVVTRRNYRYPIPRAFSVDRINRVDASVVRGWLRSAGYATSSLESRRSTDVDPLGSGGARARLLGNSLLAVATPA